MRGIRWLASQLTALGCIAALTGSLARDVLAADSGFSSVLPTLRHPSHDRRVALLLVPGSISGNARNVIAHKDEEIYGKLLRDVGFEVLTIGPASRPELDQAIRQMATRVLVGGEVALFVLGTALSDENEVYVMPADAPAETELQQGGLDAAGIRLSDVLRRIQQARTPRHFVVIVDECRRIGSAGPACAVEATTGTSGASIIAAHRVNAPTGTNEPLAQRTSIRELLAQEMVKEGQSFLDLFGTLKQRLTKSNLDVVSTSALSTEFAFVPVNYFATLPTDCNRVSANADVNVLPNLEPLLQDCERATVRWPYAPHFASQLVIVREQRAAQRAIASCGDRLARDAYLSVYPSGRYKPAVQKFAADCAALEEKTAYEKAIAACSNLTPATEYQRKYPTGRYRREIEVFVARCEKTAEEQRAYTRAIVNCVDLAPASQYLRAYPNGQYKRDVETFIAGCEHESLQRAQKAANKCDTLAANPYDLRKSAEGVPFDRLKQHAFEAVENCEIAAGQYPHELRFQYQQARALQHLDPGKAFIMHERLARLRYPAAYDNLGWLYITERSNEREGIRQFQMGTELGDPDSMVSLAEMMRRGMVMPRRPSEPLELYRRAAQLGHVEAAQVLQQIEQEGQYQDEQQRLMIEFLRTLLQTMSR
jgi:hypothetical protein